MQSVVPPHFDPYPTSIHQSVIQPLNTNDRLAVTPVAASSLSVSSSATQNTSVNTSEKPVSPDIIKLANNSDLSIETIQHEADRIRKKSEDDGEVFISLH